METVVEVKGMTCGHCKSAVEGAAKEVAGVSEAAADIEQGIAIITHDESVNIDDVKQSIEDQGYDVK
ncbi:cation transporter [Macrococcus armenti]|uniref:Cation transporter n=1 Tax=Macrococcus armenti TaxID=2875764 RepID=A0ABY3ZXW7_9STAP|nr:cation transporter [Macrococcus armenti]UOB20804.1 cation transporter [Macrococcus armenti]